MEKQENESIKIFEDLIKLEVTNFINNEKYQIVGGTDMVFSDDDILKITKICNQENTYNLLFKERLNGKPYTEDDAKGFIKWLKDGWRNQSFFVFFIRDENEKIIGAIDIKSADLNRAEIGYWADENYRGFMTNTVEEILSLAKERGFLKIFAGVRSDNSKSIGVLERSGLKRVGEEKEIKGYPHLEYEIDLNKIN
ncbi:MAG: GNAT family N-acetyltransferase [Candidatus Pacebacteria bacterium]|nr:GNAT family N-acetyltransferase [Candidatus Paceibacterota bacterium]